MLPSINQKPNRASIIWDYFPESVWKKSKVLDCASGDGKKGMQFYITKGLPPKNVTAIEKNPATLKVLDDLGVRAIQVNLENKRLSNIRMINKEKFDLIISAETLEHLTQNAEDFLIEDFLHMLNIGGHITITFPVNVSLPKNPYHKRQPNINIILEQMLPWFDNVEMRKYGWRTYILFFTGKKKRNYV